MGQDELLDKKSFDDGYSVPEKQEPRFPILDTIAAPANDYNITIRRLSTTRRVRARFTAWFLPAMLAVCIVLLTWSSHVETDMREPQRETNGLTNIVSWDNYTLWINDQRVFLM